MSLLVFSLAAQLAAATQPARQVLPVLAFPERGLDDSAAYLGYQTRLFRDAAGNTLQVYLDARAQRVVHLWADAENESLGFTARAGGKAAALQWDGAGARVSRAGRARSLEYSLVAADRRVHIGWFLMGSMRVERDLQYAERQKAPFANAPFALPEIERLLTALDALEAGERQRHLALLHATSVAELRARIRPTLSTRTSGGAQVTRIVQPALDALDSLVMELRTDPRRVTATIEGDSVTLESRGESRIPFTVRVTTSGTALSPLTRREIFNDRFLSYLSKVRREGSLESRRIERQVRGMELLVSREKLMAGLPTYATYFGRDMLMTALMMRPVWKETMSEFAIASALRKLAPDGRVSHEEALGGQAVREAASEYAALVSAGRLDSARSVLRHIRRVRENYHMIDAEYQLPIVVARWIADPDVSAARKRAFLRDRSDAASTRLSRLMRELALVARATSAYAADPRPANLISFAPRDSGRWAAQSWRDSNVGYAGGRYAMDVNVVWAPHALESVGIIMERLRALGLLHDSLTAGSPLAEYARRPATLQRAVQAWQGASSHFVVTLSPAEVRTHVTARLDAMSAGERQHWSRVLARSRADTAAFSFLALSLDAAGRPIPVANSDVATRLFLGDREAPGTAPDAAARSAVLRDVRLFTSRYPVGLLVDSVGPVVSNDAFADARVWRDFDRDRYHSPHVVWGRENNLFLIGAVNRIREARGDRAYVRELRAAIDDVLGAVNASGFRSELWSYEVANGRAVPIRYGSGSDVQLWSTTDLAVRFALSLMR